MIDSSLVYDTSALIEFYNGDNKTVQELFIDPQIENLVPSIVISELISRIRRNGQDPLKFIQMLEDNSIILAFNHQIAKKAGELHAVLKKKEKSISLIDCMIMAHAKIEDAMIVSKDNHFKHYKNSKIL